MNIIFGSASGIGKEVYNIYKSKNLDVFGIDKVDSDSTDYLFDLNNIEKIVNINEEIKNFDVSSITFSAASQDNSVSLSNTFNTNLLTFIEFLNQNKTKLNNCVVCAISSVHAVSSNTQNLYYSSSKAALEAAMRNLALNKSNNSYYVIRLGATDTQKLRENIPNLESISSILPNSKIFSKEEVSKFIFTLNSQFKNLLNGAVLQIDNGVLSMLKTD